MAQTYPVRAGADMERLTGRIALNQWCGEWHRQSDS